MTIPAEPTLPEKSLFWFDPQDHELLTIVNAVLERGRYLGLKKLLAPYLHPHGIKEMAATKGLRIAYSVVHLLSSLAQGEQSDRIEALRSLRDEVLTSAESSLQHNTARILIQIMKELVRAGSDPIRQLKLAHDFRTAISGKPRIVRAELEQYHLLEMPEEMNQLAFDDHIHDANTKGRKSPTHLVMDAWVKGIRTLTVIHYNHLQPAAASELLEAAEIMGIEARIGIEVRAQYGDGFVKLLWTPRNLVDQDDLDFFLNKPAVQDFMERGRMVSTYQQRYVWDLVELYNTTLRFDIGKRFGVSLPEIDGKRFVRFVGVGQPTTHHFGHLVSLELTRELEAAKALDDFSSDQLDPEHLIAEWLCPACNPQLANVFEPCTSPDCPELLGLDMEAMTGLLTGLHFRNRIALDLAGLHVEDILILLHEARGRITHLELFNLRSFEEGVQIDPACILELQQVVNSGNSILLKKYLRRHSQKLMQKDLPDKERLLRGFDSILNDIPGFLAMYRKRPLACLAGSDSTGDSLRHRGMGLVVADTLPPRIMRHLGNTSVKSRPALPLRLEVATRITSPPVERSGKPRSLKRLFRAFFPSHFPWKGRKQEWLPGRFLPAPDGTGNIHPLGGIRSGAPQGPARSRSTSFRSLKYLNSRQKNLLKILLGFIPASVSFALTKDWWVLAWLGPFIWFGITGIRNIIQSVLGAGGLHRSPLLKWNDYVSWERFSDSLLYTGFSVPLLDVLVKTVLLDNVFGVTTSTSPVMLYAVMACVNGVYISSHNAIRGLPRKAIIGNFFRSVLSIPIAIGLNGLFGTLLSMHGVPRADIILQKWSAIVSKFSSDCVAGVIEGVADRSKYMRLREKDISEKLDQIFATHARLEEAYPEEDVLELIESPKEFIETLAYDQTALQKVVFVNALDMLFLWMHQPRTVSVLKRKLRTMGPDERKVFLLSMYVLQREREISLLLVNGLIGRQFNRALAFYLANFQRFLDRLQKLAARF